jgi:hypothetical protein
MAMRGLPVKKMAASALPSPRLETGRFRQGRACFLPSDRLLPSDCLCQGAAAVRGLTLFVQNIQGILGRALAGRKGD